MPTTVQELAATLKLIKDEYSNVPGLNPEEARAQMAQKEAQAIADFVIGRETEVTGNASDGSTVTGTGVIQE